VAGRFLLGTQGWNYPGWVGPFYPHGAKPPDYLDIYGRAFPTVEVDSTFYAIPAPKILSGWRDQVPPDFLFALRVPQEITHEKRLVGVDQRLARFLNRVSTLEEHLGPLLIQLSPDFRASEASRETLHAFLTSLPSDFHWAVEFRQPQWLIPQTLDLLRRRNVALTLTDGRWIKRGIMLDLALEPTADFAYVRWSAAQRKAHPAGAPVDRTQELSAWVAALHTLSERVRAIHGYFGNQFQGHAPASARQMQQMMGVDSVEPALLREQAELF